MKELLGKIVRGDLILWLTIMALFTISGIVMFSAISSSAHYYEDHLTPFWGHLKHIGYGLLAMIIIHQFTYRNIRWALYFIPLLSLGLLITAPMLGHDVNGAIRSIKFMGIEIQSIELTKLAIVFLFAEILGYHNNHTDKPMTWKAFGSITGILFLFCALVFFQNISTMVMIFTMAVVMMYIGKVPFKYIGTLCGSTVVVGIVALATLLLISNYTDIKLPGRMGTAVNRIERFSQAEDQDPNAPIVITDENRQIINSKIAIANGIKFVGPGNSVQRDYLSLAFSDFVFAIIIEEYTIAGGILIILLYIIILARAGKIARRCAPHETAESLFVIGFSLLVVMQAFINMAVACELFPVTGQTLPLISRGGMSILVTCMGFGLILGISAHNEERIRKSIQENQQAEEGPASSAESTIVQDV